MRQLRLVGLAEDGGSVVLATPGGDEYRLPVDERLRAACRGDLTRLGQIEIELESPLRPREIQARVRAGESAEEVAASSGMPLDRVLRFASPMLQERERVVAQARATKLRPKDQVPLGELVEERLTGRGTDASTLRWDAWRREDGRWNVRLSWRHAAEHSANWTLELAARALRPDDPAAEQLGGEDFHARTITAVTPLAAATPMVHAHAPKPEPAAPPAATGRPGAARATGGTVGRRSDLGARSGGGRAVGGRTAEQGGRSGGGSSGAGSSGAGSSGAGSSGAGSSGAGSSGPGSSGPGSSGPGSSGPGSTAADRVTGTAASPASSGGGRGGNAAASRSDESADGDQAEQEAPRRLAAGGGAEPMLGTADEDRARRASVPSWDDILLGVRRRH